MNPVNRVLRTVNLQLRRLHPAVDPARAAELRREMQRMQEACRSRFDMRGVELRDDSGEHDTSVETHQSAFASRHVADLAPRNLLDVGSMRQWVLGLSACMPVTSVDVRPRTPATTNETVATCDARELAFEDDSFDAITSMYTIAHVGLRRYGDDLDPKGDLQAVAEMHRILKPGGQVVRTEAALWVNLYRSAPWRRRALNASRR